jgi:4-hydroxybenzoate polyprenyltransferase
MLHILIFGSTLLVYNTRYIINLQKKEPRLRFSTAGTILFVAGLVMVATGLCFMPLSIIAWCIVSGIFSFAYSWPILPLYGKRRLREFGWLKIMLLSGIWAIATAVLPILYWQKLLNDYPFEIMQRFVFVFPLCLLFDIRDMHKDMKQNISTLPLMLGLKISYQLINGTLILFVVLSLFQSIRYEAIERFVGAVLAAVATWLIAGYLRRHPSDRGYLGLADGAMLIYALLIILPA